MIDSLRLGLGTTNYRAERLHPEPGWPQSKPYGSGSGSGIHCNLQPTIQQFAGAGCTHTPNMPFRWSGRQVIIRQVSNPVTSNSYTKARGRHRRQRGSFSICAYCGDWSKAHSHSRWTGRPARICSIRDKGDTNPALDSGRQGPEAAGLILQPDRAGVPLF